MTDDTPNEDLGASQIAGEEKTNESGGLSRREALALIGKHAVYTAPAVLAVFSLTTKRATALTIP
jgi:hypothetical protein